MKGWSRLAALAAIGLCLGTGSASAHGTVHDAIARVDRKLQESPEDVSLWVRRADLHRVDRDFARAAADLTRAETLDATLADVHFFRGRLALDAGRPDEAEAAFASYLHMGGQRASAHVLRGQALRAAGRPLEAVRAFDRAIASFPVPGAEIVLARANALLEAGKPHDALQGLDAATQQNGLIPSLVLRAIEIEIEFAAWDDAIARLDALAATAQRRDGWLERRAALLERAGRASEARASYLDSRDALLALSAGLRESPATRARLHRIDAALRRIPGPEARP